MRHPLIHRRAARVTLSRGRILDRRPRIAPPIGWPALPTHPDGATMGAPTMPEVPPMSNPHPADRPDRASDAEPGEPPVPSSASTPPASRPVGADDERVQPASRAAWRAWLEANHATARGAWAVTYRRTSGRPVVPYDDLVEEALCFGWIDSRGDRLDAERTMLRFTPRKRGSTWARTNKARVERLVADGLMTPAGMRVIEEAKADGSWDALNDSDALRVPEDLADELSRNPAAARGFAALSPSARKAIIFQVTSAKRPETRARRIADVVRYAAVGRSPLEWPRRPLEE
jgi:uncharacterized protein YdeI (YjbR/CyaY-like superfamily)